MASATSTSSSSSSINLIIVLFSFSLQIIQLPAVKLPPGVHFPAVIVFGDSIVDPGNNNNRLTIGKSNYLPYGRDFMGGNKPTGRFSNGRIPSDILVSLLGIKELLPAYLDPTLTPDDLLTGVSFGSGGVGFDPISAKLTGDALSLPDQLKLFEEYLGKVRRIGGEEKAQSIASESLYVIACGSNDLTNTYWIRLFMYTIPGYADFLVRAASTFIQGLYKLGARRIWVLNVPQLGCLPAQRTMHGGLPRNCSAMLNYISQVFNSKLSSELDDLNRNLPQLKAVYVDISKPLDDLVQNPGKEGFEEVTKGCCGTGLIEVIYLCNELTPFTCKDADKYIFWDGFHPTQKTYEVLVTALLDKYLSSFF